MACASDVTRACWANTVTQRSARMRFAGRKVMEVNDKETSQIPFGMFELDAAGTVLHYSPASEDKRVGSDSLIGKNFFGDLISIAQMEELKGRFLSFMADGDSVERFTISFPYKQESVKVQIVMAHLTEKSERGRERFAIIRLMPERYAPAATTFADA
jgi:photoactive yellow protein